MTGRIFLDTNLWVYLFSEDIEKGGEVARLIGYNFGNVRLCPQVLSELFNVLTKKKILTPEDASQIVHRVSDEFPVSPIDKTVVKRALDLKLKYHFSYWDSLIISSALGAQCDVLYTEDLQHNQVIEKKLKILNPFFA